MKKKDKELLQLAKDFCEKFIAMSISNSISHQEVAFEERYNNAALEKSEKLIRKWNKENYNSKDWPKKKKAGKK